MKMLDVNKIEYSRMSSLDRLGRTFYYDGKFFRGIYKQKVNEVNEMFSCGLVDELIHEELIPSTKISEYSTNEFPLIIEHELVKPVTYVFEWTFHMLCDAAQMVLRLDEVLQKYGYKLWDCHTYNVLFSKNKPLYVDFGSFYKKNSVKRAFPLEQFKADYIITPEMYRVNGALARCALKANDSLTYEDLYSLSGGVRRDGLKKRVALFQRINRKLYNNVTAYEEFLKNTYKRKVIAASERSVNKSRWSDYQQIDSSFFESIGKKDIEGFERFEKIIEIIDRLNISSVYEWGGNNGLLAMLVCGKNKGIKQYYCSDYDDYSVDNLYLNIKANADKYNFLNSIKPVVASFWDPVFLKEKNGSNRMKAELVIGCAITHHLLLAQGINIDVMFETFASYTCKHIIIEFMPLGLWAGEEKVPDLPEFYTLDWFVEHMSKFFDVDNVEQLEKNRILLLGHKKELA